MYIAGTINNIFNGEFSLGIYTQEGINEFKEEFQEIVIGLFLFEIYIYIYIYIYR